ncbi:MAG: transposase [Phycisphaerales bacterium]|nr:transposase [Phycisphaerales bacterium]
MMGRKQQRQEQLFYTAFSLDERIGPDNRLRRINDAVDFSFVRSAVSNLYGPVGNPSVDPIVLLKLMLISFLENVPGERELMRRLPERLDWLWFCQYDLDSTLPNHSALSKARRRFGQRRPNAGYDDRPARRPIKDQNSRMTPMRIVTFARPVRFSNGYRRSQTRKGTCSIVRPGMFVDPVGDTRRALAGRQASMARASAGALGRTISTGPTVACPDVGGAI